MKAFIVFACVIAVAKANGYAAEHTSYAAPIVATTKMINTGHSEQTRKQDAAGNYAFSYNEQHKDGGSSRKESGDGWGNKVGSYSLNVADGRQRTVKYVADAHGFRAAIATNEPGTAAKPAAATSISSPYAAPVAPAPLGHGYAAPLAYASAPALEYGKADAGYGAGYGAGLALDAGYGKGAEIAHAAPAYNFGYSTAVEHASYAAAPSYGKASLGYGSHY